MDGELVVVDDGDWGVKQSRMFYHACGKAWHRKCNGFEVQPRKKKSGNAATEWHRVVRGVVQEEKAHRATTMFQHHSINGFSKRGAFLVPFKVSLLAFALSRTPGSFTTQTTYVMSTQG